MADAVITDVIIIGAGPTGLALACQFIRYGVDFVIFDKKENITPYSKAIGVQARTLEIYEQLNLAQKLVEQGTITERARLLEGGEVRGEIELSNLGRGLSPYPFLLIVEQSKHEHILYDFIKDRGRDVLWRTTLENFSQDERGVRANIIDANGEAQTIEAKYLVGCDGAKSSVRNALGMTFEGSTFERLFYVADVQIDWQFGHDALHACLARDTVTAFFPMPGEKRYRIVGTFPEGLDRDEDEILYEEIERQISKDTQLTLDIYNVNWFSTYKVHSRRVNKFSEGRCFLAGDAAHIHSPAGAQGMNTGIQDGYNLAWKLALVVQNQAEAGILASYNEERLENARRLLETTDRFFEFGASPSWFLAWFRTNIFPHIANFFLGLETVQQFIFPLVSQIGINYHNSSLSMKGDGKFEVKAGDRMPYFLIDGKSIYDHLREPSFHLLTFSDSQGDNQATGNEIESRYARLVDYHAFPLHPRAAEIFGTDSPFNLLLRPDNYIAFVSHETSTSGLRDYLKNAIGHS